ncbi:MAG: gluconeogenesis factor YvcK family protein [Patescibacteria group bacterium]
MAKRKNRKSVVAMGGGTGTYAVLTALKKYPELDLKAVVAMTDDGGSTGVLRDELGVLPPGDIRQCLVALSEAPETVRELLNYRFDNGSLKGHSFGNLFLSALEKVSGSFEKGIAEISKIIRIKGEVIPVVLNSVKLAMVLKNGTVLEGERNITPSEFIQPIGIKKYYLKPKAKINPKAQKATLNAKAIIIGPGNLYTSIIPLFLVDGLKQTLKQSKAKKILIINLITKFGQTDNFSIFDFVAEIEKFLGKGIIDLAVFNTQEPQDQLIKRYFRLEKSKPIVFRLQKSNLPEKARPLSKNRFVFNQIEFIGGNLIGNNIAEQSESDHLIKRNLIRHDYKKLGKFLSELIFSLD